MKSRSWDAMVRAERRARRERELWRQREIVNSYQCGCGHLMAWHGPKWGLPRWRENHEGPCGYPGCECEALDLRDGCIV